jgi:hypothetical protein
MAEPNIEMNNKGTNQVINTRAAPLSNPDHYPDLMTEKELILFLRIPEVSKAKNYHNVIKNMIRFRHLPRIQICKRLLFPKKAILDWIEKETIKK